MTKEEAFEKLSQCERHELRDHAFGDREITWIKNDLVVAAGYFGSTCNIGFVLEKEYFYFEGHDAVYLSSAGTVSSIERNDSTGPEKYEDGVVMPSLTLEGVRKELEEDKKK